MTVTIQQNKIEEESKKFLSLQLKIMENAGFGHLSEICRVAIFENKEYNEKLLPIFLKNNPEITIE